jgi:hypothetical protein
VPRTKARLPGARADYLDGDPAAPGPITGGTLAVDGRGLLFRRPGEAEFRLGISELYGMTVSGARARRKGFKARQRGTTRVAVVRDRRPMLWEFAVDRSKAILLRERINRALGAIGRPPLPFVEALDGFATPAPAPLSPVDRDKPAKHGMSTKQRRLLFAGIGAMILLEVVLPLLILKVF